LTRTWALGWLSARTGRLSSVSCRWDHGPDIFGHEGRGWLLEHLLELLIGVVEPVLEACNLRFLMGRALKVLHRQKGELLGVQELREVCEDQVNVLGRMSGLAGAPQQESLLKEVEKSLILVDSLLPDLEMSSFLPEIRHKVHFIREYVADDSRVNILPSFQKLVAEGPGDLLDLASVLVGDDVGESLLPAAALLASEAWCAGLLNYGGEVVLGNGLDHLLDKDVLVEGEVLGLDLVKELFASRFGDQESLGGSSSFQGDPRGPASFAQQKILLDDSLGSLVPVGVARNGLLHYPLSTASGGLALGLEIVGGLDWLRLLRSLLFLLAKLGEEICGAFGRHRWQV